METLYHFAYLIGIACLVSVLLCTSFVAMIMAKTVRAKPDVFDIKPGLLDIADKYSRATFAVSCIGAIIVYMYGAIMIIFHFLPEAVAAVLSQ